MASVRRYRTPGSSRHSTSKPATSDVARGEKDKGRAGGKDPARPARKGYASAAYGQRAAPSSRETPRAASLTAAPIPRSSPRAMMRSVESTTPIAPTAWPPWSKIGAAALDSPSTASSRSVAMPESRITLSSWRRSAPDSVCLVKRGSGSASRSSSICDGEQARTELVLVRIAVLLHEAVRLKGLEQAVDSGPGEAETFRELADAEPAGSARQRLQDRRGAVDRLDRRAALAGCAIIRHC